MVAVCVGYMLSLHYICKFSIPYMQCLYLENVFLYSFSLWKELLLLLGVSSLHSELAFIIIFVAQT